MLLLFIIITSHHGGNDVNIVHEYLYKNFELHIDTTTLGHLPESF